MGRKPRQAQARAARAQAYVGAGKHEAALQECNRVFAKACHMEHSDTWVVKLSALYEMGRIGEADGYLKSIQSSWGKGDARFVKLQCKIEGAMQLRPNFYGVLGVSKTASDRELRKAYRLLSRKCHPDRFVNSAPEEKQRAANQFQKLNEAVEFLTDSFMRQQYDEGHELDKIRQRAFIRTRGI